MSLVPLKRLVCKAFTVEITELLACDAACSHCFEWQSCLQHEALLQHVFHTNYFTGLPGMNYTKTSQGMVS